MVVMFFFIGAAITPADAETATMTYRKIADTEHGELGHNGFSWVLDHPYDYEHTDDALHPAYYEDCGLLERVTSWQCDGVRHMVTFRKTFGPTRSGRERAADLVITLTLEQAQIGIANRAAHDAIYKPAGGYVIITD